MISPAEDLFARCDECGKLQVRRVLDRGETAFPVRCAFCDDPAEDFFDVSITALVAVSVARSDDRDEWRVRVLDERDVRRARAASQWMAMTFCPRCDRVHEGYEAEFGGFSETHIPARCPICEQPTQVIALEPAIVSRSHDDDEWYVVILESDEIEQVRCGVPLAGPEWSS